MAWDDTKRDPFINFFTSKPFVVTLRYRKIVALDCRRRRKRTHLRKSPLVLLFLWSLLWLPPIPGIVLKNSKDRRWTLPQNYIFIFVPQVRKPGQGRAVNSILRPLPLFSTAWLVCLCLSSSSGHNKYVRGRRQKAHSNPIRNNSTQRSLEFARSAKKRNQSQSDREMGMRKAGPSQAVDLDLAHDEVRWAIQ